MHIDVAIITIREDEFKAVRQRFTTKRYRAPEGRHYLIGEVKANDDIPYSIAICRSINQGNDASQSLTNDIIRDLSPGLILVVGIAGGIPNDEVTLGDVIISTNIINLNVDAHNPDGSVNYVHRGGPPHPLVEQLTSLLPGEPLLNDWNKSSLIRLERPGMNLEQANISGDEEWRRRVYESLRLHFGDKSDLHRHPLAVTGSIVSSNHLIKNHATIKDIMRMDRSILAVEMESAGVYEAARKPNRSFPVMAIRGISDIIGLQRDKKWTEYACQTAAAFSFALITSALIDTKTNMQEDQQARSASSMDEFMSRLGQSIEKKKNSREDDSDSLDNPKIEKRAISVESDWDTKDESASFEFG